MTSKNKEIDKVKELDLKIIRGGLIPEYKGSIVDRKYIFIDLDSIFSIFLTNDDKIPEEYDQRVSLAEDIVSIIKYFLSLHIRYSEIFFFYRLEKGTHFPSIYPKWNNERYKRFNNDEVVIFLHKILINNIKKLSKNTDKVKIVKCTDDTILTVKNYIKRYNYNDIVIHSRDPHYLCLFHLYKEICIFDGKSYMTGDTYKVMRSKSLPELDPYLLPYYFLICGMKRNEYKGKDKYGPKKTIAYINDRLEDVLNKTDSITLELKDYRKLFFI